MKNIFIPYKESLELNKLGFDEKCLSYYLNSVLETKEFFLFKHSYRSHSTQQFISAPLYQQVFEWFRKEYSLYHNIWNYTHSEPPHKMIPYGFTFSIDEDWICIVGKNHETGLFENYYKTYELAELACLRKLIELAKKQQ